jgi:hypothetical protein
MSKDPHAEEIHCSRALNVYYFTEGDIEIWFSFVPREIPLGGNLHAICATRMVCTE